jgi:hypothetical protein
MDIPMVTYLKLSISHSIIQYIYIYIVIPIQYSSMTHESITLPWIESLSAPIQCK